VSWLFLEKIILREESYLSRLIVLISGQDVNSDADEGDGTDHTRRRGTDLECEEVVPSEGGERCVGEVPVVGSFDLAELGCRQDLEARCWDIQERRRYVRGIQETADHNRSVCVRCAERLLLDLVVQVLGVEGHLHGHCRITAEALSIGTNKTAYLN